MKLIPRLFYLLFFLTPLLVSPISFELFEFPKMIFVYIITILITTAWAIESIKQKRFIFRSTPLDIPILIFLISQTLSTIFSIDTRTSLLGYYSRFNQGLFSTISYTILYYAAINFLSKKHLKKSINLLLTSASISSLYAIFQHFGIDAHLWVQDVQNRVFSSLGQPNWLAAFLITLIPIPISLYLKKPKPIYMALFSIFTLTLLYTKSRSGLLAFTASYTVFWTLILFTYKAKSRTQRGAGPKKAFLLFTGIILTISLFDGLKWIPQIKNTFSNQAKAASQTQTSITPQVGGTESGDIRKIVWKGAINVWKNYPILGSGVETFAYSYYNFRPIEHNLVSEWDFVYNKAHNEYLNYLATTGLVGLLTYLSIQLTFIVYILKNLNAKRLLLVAILSGYIGLSLTNFFGFSTVLTSLLFFLIPAIAITQIQDSRFKIQESKQNLSIQQTILIIFILIATSYLFFTISKWYLADTYFASGTRSQNYQKLQQAFRLMPQEPNFTAKLAESSAQKYLIDKNKSLGEQAIILAETVKKQNPVHLKFVKSYARVYLTLSQANPAFLEDAKQELLRGTNLSPTDAKLRYNLGLIAIQQENLSEAEKHLKAAIALKPNYDTARYALGVFYEDQNNLQKAREQYQYILNFISPQNQNVIDKLNTLN